MDENTTADVVDETGEDTTGENQPAEAPPVEAAAPQENTPPPVPSAPEPAPAPYTPAQQHSYDLFYRALERARENGNTKRVEDLQKSIDALRP